jgi:NCAIR mutase (PurE)-related protein
MRDILDAVAAGELTPAAAEAQLAGYVTGEAGRFDTAREQRSGVPEAVLAAGKTPEEVTSLAATSLDATGHAFVTRADDVTAAAVSDAVAATVRYRDRSGVLVARASDYQPPDLNADVGVVTAGTADAVPAGEATAVLAEMGVTVTRLDDVGVASLTRLTDQLDRLRDRDILVVAAGREGALPTVVAGLVDVPVIGLPVSTGYGAGGDGEAALSGMLQSCTALTTVNIDAGFTAGAQAGLLAQQLDAARDADSPSR